MIIIHGHPSIYYNEKTHRAKDVIMGKNPKLSVQGGTDRAVQSPEYKEIYSAVIDTYMNNAVLRLLSSSSSLSSSSPGHLLTTPTCCRPPI